MINPASKSQFWAHIRSHSVESRFYMEFAIHGIYYGVSFRFSTCGNEGKEAGWERERS
jgi:hypothetical protein